MSALIGSQAAIDAISGVCGVMTPFPGGIVSSGSKVGTLKYEKFGLVATTNEKYCPTLKDKVEDSKVPDGVNAMFEIVIDGLDEDCIKEAMAEGIRAATHVPGVKIISAGNFGGNLGPFKINLHEIL
jgi:formylmethanofuran--tetrahydromethanopterin N-formyltransferase